MYPGSMVSFSQSLQTSARSTGSPSTRCPAIPRPSLTPDLYLSTITGSIKADLCEDSIRPGYPNPENRIFSGDMESLALNLRTPNRSHPAKPGVSSTSDRMPENILFRGKEEVIKKPTKEIGEQLYTSLGCIGCHSMDAGKPRPNPKWNFRPNKNLPKPNPLR